MIEHLSFYPFLGIRSRHFQTIMACFLKAKHHPPYQSVIIPVEDGDALLCDISTPPTWKIHQKTVVLLHGLGGSHVSNYMLRMSQKLYQAGYRTVRVNLRGCGTGAHLARRPYHGGTSHDVLSVIHALKLQYSDSPIVLLGFSLGGNIALKLAGELGEQGGALLDHTIAICPPIDLASSLNALNRPVNYFYHRYFLKIIKRQVKRWLGNQKIRSILEFDNAITAPLWGFQDAADYHRQCSSLPFIPKIQHRCHILLTKDDPFIDYQLIKAIPTSKFVKIGLCSYGGHLGFLGWADKEHRYNWLDSLLLNWIKGAPNENVQSVKETANITLP